MTKEQINHYRYKINEAIHVYNLINNDEHNNLYLTGSRYIEEELQYAYIITSRLEDGDIIHCNGLISFLSFLYAHGFRAQIEADRPRYGVNICIVVVLQEPEEIPIWFK